MDLDIQDNGDFQNTISRKPKYIDNIWKILLFLYSCVIQAITIALSLLDTPSLIVQDIYMFFLYLFASSIILVLLIFLHINRKQTFEEAYRENSNSNKLTHSLSGEKVGLYLRFGLVLIGLFSLTYIALSNARVLTSKPGCLNTGLIITSTSQSLFVILQAIFILKYHSIIILKYNRLIQFGLFNIILVNIVTWEISCLSKISYSGNLIVANDNCTIKEIESLHLFFLPAVAEYSVIGMAILYEILKRIGKISLIETLPELGSSNFVQRIQNAIPGLIIGIFIVLLCISFTIFIILSDKFYHAKWVFFAHNIEEIILYVFAIIILLVAFSRTSKLKFSFTFLQNSIDKNLLYVSSFLSIVFSTMICTYCFIFSTETIRIIRGIASLLEIIQIILQTIVIQDSFYRCSDSTEQHNAKPGQNFFAILIGCNFGLWLLKSFQLKNGDIFFNKYQTVIQNKVLFSFFLYATLPLSVLYRYHSSCCFAGAFSKIYQGEADRFEGMLRAEGFDHCPIHQSKKLCQNNYECKDPKLRSRAKTLPTIPDMSKKCQSSKNGLSKGTIRRQTLKNLETAKLRILSSQLSQTLVRKKLSPLYVIESDSSSSTLQDNKAINDFNLLTLKRHPLLKRHSSNPLELSTLTNFIFPTIQISEDVNDENDESNSVYRSIEVLSPEDNKVIGKKLEIIRFDL